MKRRCVVAPVVFLALILCGGTVFLHAQEISEDDSLKVQKFAFCMEVKDREPVGVSKEFSLDDVRVYLWTAIYGAEEPTTIKHVWYLESKKMLEVPLKIRYKRTRTWSYKTLYPGYAGKWHVEIVDEKGRVLKKVSFEIK